MELEKMMPWIPANILESTFETIGTVLINITEEDVRAKKTGDKHLYRSSESNVESHLIRPILQALGWDMSDKRQVETQYWSLSDDRPDFALKKSGEYLLAIEAKALGKANPKKWADRIERYLSFCPLVVLSDGIEWRLYKSRDDEYIKFSPDYPYWYLNIREHNILYSLHLLTSFYQGSEDFLKHIAFSYGASLHFLSSMFKFALDDVLSEQNASYIITDALAPLVIKKFHEKYEHLINDDEAIDLLSDNDEYVKSKIVEKLTKE